MFLFYTLSIKSDYFQINFLKQEYAFGVYECLGELECMNVKKIIKLLLKPKLQYQKN